MQKQTKPPLVKNKYYSTSPKCMEISGTVEEKNLITKIQFKYSLLYEFTIVTKLETYSVSPLLLLQTSEVG